MSEVTAELQQFAEDKNPESNLVDDINVYFDQAVSILRPEEYIHLGSGDSVPIQFVEGVGHASLSYLGSRYLPKLDNEPQRPLQECNYKISVAAHGHNQGSNDPEPIGWWMPAHLEHGPRLVLDSVATTEELMGSTLEDRQTLEMLFKGLAAALPAHQLG